MRKSIVALLLLLFVLIITCVYQKTSVIYDKQAKSTSGSQKVVRQEDTNTKTDAQAVKEIQTNKAAHPLTENKPVKTFQSTPVKKSQITLSKSSMKTTAKNTRKDKVSEATQVNRGAHVSGILKPIQMSQPIKRVDVEKKTVVILHSAPIKRPFIVFTETHLVQEKISLPKKQNPLQALATDTEDLETIDHLMKTLEKKNIAVQRRDKIEAKIEVLIKKALAKREMIRAKIEVLIKKALENRVILIQNIAQEEQELLYMQMELLKTRDALSKKIAKQHKKNTGE